MEARVGMVELDHLQQQARKPVGTITVSFPRLPCRAIVMAVAHEWRRSSYSVHAIAE